MKLNESEFGLSGRIVDEVTEAYAAEFSLAPKWMAPDGIILSSGVSSLDRLSWIRRVRLHALEEAVRWGEPYVFFLAPGIVSWMTPLVERQEVRGGLVGGEVLAEDEPEDRLEGVNHLVSNGVPREEASLFVRELAAWPQERTQKAADRLSAIFYSTSRWSPDLLRRNRERALQQKEIAEEIHRRKGKRETGFPVLEERALLSLIRAGDRKGARKLLNRYLGAVFLQSPDLVVVRALLIELLGYLVRTAVQDSPYLGSLIERNHRWTGRIVSAEDFEELAQVVREALDDFMGNIYLLRYQRGHPAVTRALELIESSYRETGRLDAVAEATGLSRFRIAHLVKEQTGKSVLGHVQEMRIRQAQELLEESTLSCAQIAYEVGFSDQSYFTRQFKKLTGITPGRHRSLYESRKARASVHDLKSKES